jgi:hypothetical protein
VEKDVWDVRRIPNARYTVNRSDYLLSFKNIPPLFRKPVKDYCKFALTYSGQGKLSNQIRGLECFITFIKKSHLDWNDFSQLRRDVIEKFLSYLHQINNGISEYYKHVLLSSVNSFLNYLQRSEHSYAPIKPIITLLFKEDFPKIPKQNENKIKFIPETVMNQLELLLNLNPEDITPPMDDKEKENKQLKDEIKRVNGKLYENL